MFVCLSKKLFQCASGCLCQETILPRVSFPRGSTWMKMVMTRKNRCQPTCVGQNRLLGCARRRLALSSAVAFLLVGFSGSLTSCECGSYVYEKRDLWRPNNEYLKVSLIYCREVRLFCIRCNIENPFCMSVVIC